MNTNDIIELSKLCEANNLEFAWCDDRNLVKIYAYEKLADMDDEEDREAVKALSRCFGKRVLVFSGETSGFFGFNTPDDIKSYIYHNIPLWRRFYS